jgi:hypothetical protein
LDFYLNALSIIPDPASEREFAGKPINVRSESYSLNNPSYAKRQTAEARTYAEGAFPAASRTTRNHESSLSQDNPIP